MLPTVSVCSKNKWPQHRSHGCWSCALCGDLQLVPQCLAFFETPFKSFIRVFQRKQKSSHDKFHTLCVHRHVMVLKTAKGINSLYPNSFSAYGPMIPALMCGKTNKQTIAILYERTKHKEALYFLLCSHWGPVFPGQNLCEYSRFGYWADLFWHPFLGKVCSFQKLGSESSCQDSHGPAKGSHYHPFPLCWLILKSNGIF